MFGFVSKWFSGQRTPGRKATYQPQFDDLEKRELMTVSPLGALLGTTANYKITQVPTAAGLALINSLPDLTVRATALGDYQDGVISRNDMIDIFFKGSVGFTDLTNAALSSMQTLVNNGTTVRMPDYVQFLATKSLHGPYYPVGSSPTAQTLKSNVDDFFLGLKHPDAGSNAYFQVNKPLWNSSPSPKDVYQTIYPKTNWLLTGLEEVVSRNRADITSMFIDNGDGTWTVRFYRMNDVKVPMWVTVDRSLPTGNGEEFGDTSHSGVLWVALAVKAYAQANGYGASTVQTVDPFVGGTGWSGSSYKALGLLSTAPVDYALPNPTFVSQFVKGLDGSGSYGGSLTGQLQWARQDWLKGQSVSLLTRSDASSLFYPAGGTQPRWYALVNYVPDAAWDGRYTVTEDGKRYIEVPGKVLADHFNLVASSTGNPATVPMSAPYAASTMQLFQVTPPLQTLAAPTSLISGGVFQVRAEVTPVNTVETSLNRTVTLASNTGASVGALAPRTLTPPKAGASKLQAMSAGVLDSLFSADWQG
ncbi:MAG TPA: hypothetical protein VE988_18130 [Gemmataceae bacterium]|nr:hypothetical protein [Gemmataceae bacterium]